MRAMTKSPRLQFGLTSLFALSLAAALAATTAACGDNLKGVDEGDPICGDGNIDADEQCDDGNVDPGDGCSATCTTEDVPAVCGNGEVEEGEACDDGNVTEFDGCEVDCTASPAEFTCSTPEPLATGVCEVTAGTSGQLIIGTVLAPNTVLRGGQVLVSAEGQIECVGCDCGTAATDATVVNCPQAVVSPGLINPHDHISFANNEPYVDTGERYEHRHDWRRGRNGHTEISVSGQASDNEIRYGELRFLMGGATSVIGAGSASGFLRNLDRDEQEGLDEPQVDLDTFPLGEGSRGEQLDLGCHYPNITEEGDIADEEAYSPHVAEGIDAFARNEFLCLSRNDFGGQDLLEQQSSFIHGASLNPIDFAHMTDQGASLIWSPRSNVTLYGDTASVTTAARLNVSVALGTDWVSTGSMNLLRELRCADSLNTDYYDSYFTDKDMWRMVTVNAAEVAAMDDRIGSLIAGRVADIAIYDGSTNLDYRAIIDAEAGDITLVMRGGEAIYGDEAVVAALAGGGCDTIDVCGTNKGLCTMNEINMTLAELETDVGNQYNLFFCTDPDNEPSCMPTRSASVNGSTIYDGVPTSTDNDGDGIENSADNCMNVFNPIRPVDNGAQADYDGDGAGDRCDECPIDPLVTDCLAFVADDPDADGVATADDNCPEVPNADQADGDSDGNGDACDACPATPNLAPEVCPATIYEIKTRTSPTLVSVADALVTACLPGSGYFLQVHEDEAGYAGPENSGLFTFDPNTDCGVTISAGDRINITPSARVGEFFGQTQLSFATFAIVTNANPLPAPTVLTPAQAGGDVPNEYEGILATIEDVSVIDDAPPPTGGESQPINEFEVTGPIRVDDLFFLTANFPANGAIYDSITGILAYRRSQQKIHPRMEEDLVAGPPTLIGFVPALSYIRENDMDMPTFPTPLTITLTSPPVADTVITVVSGTPGSLTVNNVSVLAGETTAVVPVTGVAQDAAVTITATFDGVSMMADVRVIGAAENPAVVSLEPDGGSVGVGGMLTMTVNLDIPAPVGGTVVNLATAPGTSGTVPASVTVAEDALSGDFTFTALAAAGVETVTATEPLTVSMATATVNVVAGAGLVINEVDYDQVGGDALEFVELHNTTGAAITLDGLSLVLVNGSAAQLTQYLRVDLAGSLPAGGYAVVGSQALLDTITADIEIFIGVESNAIQNGSPDGVGLFDAGSSTLLDALSYEGSITAATTDFGTVDLTEGTELVDSDSNADAGGLSRIPNGTDTNDSDADWAFTANVTPGAANVE